MRAHFTVTADDLKALASVSSHELVNRHIHKLIQVSFLLFHLWFGLVIL